MEADATTKSLLLNNNTVALATEEPSAHLTVHRDRGIELSDDEISSKLPLILNGKYFSVLSNTDDGKVSAKCLKCTTPKTISGFVGSTSNFVTHLKRKHKNDYLSFEEEKNKTLDEKRRKKATTVSILAGKAPPTSQKKITTYLAGRPTQSMVDSLVKNYVVNSMKPLRTVEEESFIDLVTGLCPGSKVISRKRLKNAISEEDKTRRNETKLKLSKAGVNTYWPPCTFNGGDFYEYSSAKRPPILHYMPE